MKKISWAIGILSVLHLSLLLLFAGPEGAFSLEGNFARTLDLAILGERHVYTGYGIPFDPEGLLGTLTSTCTVLLGYIIGMAVREGKSPVDTSAKVFVLSAAFLLAGVAMGIWIPISKPLWTVSYVFYCAGWASFVFALLMYLIDVKGWEKPFFPFKALGMNALALFVLSGLAMKVIWRYTDWDYTQVFGGSEEMSLLFAVLYLLPHLLIAILLYKKKIFIKL
jgi:predicted acyltransferase